MNICQLGKQTKGFWIKRVPTCVSQPDSYGLGRLLVLYYSKVLFCFSQQDIIWSQSANRFTSLSCLFTSCAPSHSLWFGYHSFSRFYSLYGHVETMAREIQRGANEVQGVEATLWQVIVGDKKIIICNVGCSSGIELCLTCLEWSRYLKHFPTWYCKRWRPLQSQRMCQRSGQNNSRRLMVFCSGFLLVLE